MLRRLAHRVVSAAEADLGVPLNYLRDIVDASLPAFVKFGLFMPLAQHRKRLPAAPYHLARIAVTRREDCGTCVQIEVNNALRAGVSTDAVRAVAEGRTAGLPAELADAVRFAETVAAAGDEGALRETLRGRYGDDGLVELVLGIASARVFPTVKRALGYSKACALVPIDYHGAPA
jgi:alkylhydroperoxidase family enzyme